MAEKTTLLLTSKDDVTSDMLTPFFQSRVIRIDLDMMQTQRIACRGRIWQIGEVEIDIEFCIAVYWRKPSEPICGQDQVQNFEYWQRLYLLRSLSQLAKRRGIWHLVDPLHELHFPKPFQLTVATDFFSVPEWGVFVGGCDRLAEPIVSKALAAVPVKNDRFLVTTRISDSTVLDPAYTWFLQHEVNAKVDATVIFCCGRLWSFILPRPPNGEWVDWRVVSENHKPDRWLSCELPCDVETGVLAFMSELGLHFARLDFLVDHGDRWWFLEANPNGQFAWLDPTNQRGILEFVAACAEREIGNAAMTSP